MGEEPRRRLRIAIVTGYLPRDRAGGAQIQAVRMARELARSHDVTLFARGDESAGAELVDEPFELVTRQPVERRGIRLFDDARIAVNQIRARRHALDASVCYQALVAGFIGARAKAKLDLPCLVSIRGRHEYRMDRFDRFRLLVPYVFRTADRVLLQTAALVAEVLDAFDRRGLRDVRRLLEERIRIVPNGVEQHAARETTGEGLVYVGRLLRGKGLDELMTVIRQLPDARLTLVGDGPERERLERLAAELPVTFTGQVSHERAIDHIAKASCLVLPSHSEAFPNVILEAMSRGVPVVATRIGGIVELVEEGVTGLLVPVRDPAALQQALERIGADAELRRAMGLRGHAAATRYSWPSAAERLADEIAAVLSERAMKTPAVRVQTRGETKWS